MASQALADWRPASEDHDEGDASPADRVPGWWHDENSAGEDPGRVGVLPFFHATIEVGEEDGCGRTGDGYTILITGRREGCNVGQESGRETEGLGPDPMHSDSGTRPTTLETLCPGSRAWSIFGTSSPVVIRRAVVCGGGKGKWKRMERRGKENHRTGFFPCKMAPR